MMNKPLQNLILFGGSFDPIHYGHLNTALALQAHFHFQKFLFLPCKIPALKEKTKASEEQRIQMLKLALEPYPQFAMDLRELQRTGPSYTIDTLESFRHELGGNVAMTLLLGHDAFNQLPQWHRWESMIDQCHIVVMDRPDTPLILTGNLRAFNQKYQTFSEHDLFTQSHGKIFHYNAGQYDITSTAIREKLRNRQDVSAYLPASVDAYIKASGLYLP